MSYWCKATMATVWDNDKSITSKKSFFDFLSLEALLQYHVPSMQWERIKSIKEEQKEILQGMKKEFWLIHSADPQSRPVVIIVFAHVVRTPSIHFSKSNKTNFKRKQCLFTTGDTVCLAEWIIDDTCLIFLFPLRHFFLGAKLRRRTMMT